jgi:streptogrisin D
VRPKTTVRVLVLSSFILTASFAALPTGATPPPPTSGAVSTATCSHNQPMATSAKSEQLSEPTSETDSRPLGDAIGEGINQAIRSMESMTETGRPTSGLPYGLSQGVVGIIGSVESGYKVVVDSDAAERKYNQAMAKSVPQAGMKMVSVERSCVSAKVLANAWTKLGNRTWHPDATKTTFTADLDPATEKVVVEYDEDTDPDVVAALKKIDPDVLSATAGRPERMDRLNDTPTGGHWGGARINSTVRYCTAGFSVVRRSLGSRASVTAGHCGANGTLWVSGMYYYGTTNGRTNYPDYDQALLTGSSYGPKIWTYGAGDTEDVRTVKSAADPAVGQLICQSGSFSNSICGIRVDSISAKYCDTDGCTSYVIKGTKGGAIVIRGGDSGGPMYTKPAADAATIRGMAFAGGGCASSACTTIYAERYQSIAGHLNIYVLTG